MNLTLLNDVLKNEPSFRLKQIKQAIFKNLIGDWSEAKTLPLPLRKILKEKCPLEIKAQFFSSKNQPTNRALITLEDKLQVEAVLMRHRDGRNTVCVSSQVGCPIGCAFCATGKMGFKRSLNEWEIIEQVILFARYLKKSGAKVTNVVFMGMGEPFLNYQNVLSAIKILNKKDGFNLGARRFSISTVGIIEGIKKLAEEKMEINLAVSLHAGNDRLREKLIPSAQKYSIAKILDAVDQYLKKTHRKVMFEYLLLRNVNDSEEYAEQLAKLMKKKLYHVNLILYNETGVFKPSSFSQVKKFKQILENRGIKVTERYRFGHDIEAACGQLIVKSQ